MCLAEIVIFLPFQFLAFQQVLKGVKIYILQHKNMQQYQCETDVKPVSHKPLYCSLRHVTSSRLENLQPLPKLRNVYRSHFLTFTPRVICLCPPNLVLKLTNTRHRGSSKWLLGTFVILLFSTRPTVVTIKTTLVGFDTHIISNICNLVAPIYYSCDRIRLSISIDVGSVHT